MTTPLDVEGLKRVAEALPAWARGTWEIDLDASADFFSVRTTLDGDVDGDTGQHIVIGGDQITAIPDVSCDDAIAEFIATFDPPTVLSLLSELEAVKGERDDQVRQLVALRLSRLAHGDLCRLSVMFGRSSDLRTDQDIRINEWLKAQIADAKGEL